MRLWVFDNDGTLYDDRPTHAQFQSSVNTYCAEQYGWPEEESGRILEQLRSLYGTSSSIIALILGGRAGYEELVAATYLHLDLPQLDSEAEARNRILRTIVDPCVVLTNNPSEHARRVLGHLGLADYFEAIFGMRETDFILKPDSRAFATVEQAFAGVDEIIFCDDSLANLDGAARLGWRTIWYRPEDDPVETTSNHLKIRSFGELTSMIDQA